MNSKGMTFVELIITIAILAIIATFTVANVGAYLSSAQKNSFISNTNEITKAAKASYLTDPGIWSDDQVTLDELTENDHIVFTDKDPWGGEYDYSKTIITATKVTNEAGSNIEPVFYLDANNTTTFDTYSILFSCTIVTTKATLGFDSPLNFYTTNDIVLIDYTPTVIDRIAQSFTGNVTESFSTSDDPDDITVEKDIRKHTTVTTNGGDDSVTINENLEYYSELDTGSGNDVVQIDGYLRNNSTLSTGDGDDDVTISKNIQLKSTIDTGDGNDTITIDKAIYDSTVKTGNGNDIVDVKTIGKNSDFDLGDGNDTVNVGKNLYLATLESGNGNDTINITKDLHSDGKINTGNGDDTISVGGSVSNGHIDTGDGNDTITSYYLRNDSSISTGDGEDTVIITDIIGNFDGYLNMGNDDDYLTIKDNRLDKIDDCTISGGSGNDTLNLPNTTLKEWNKGAKDIFSGFETIILEDTTITN